MPGEIQLHDLVVSSEVRKLIIPEAAVATPAIYIGIGGPLMAQAYTLIRGLGECAAAREQFNYLVDRLQSKETAGMEHGEIEELIRADGMGLLRRLLQGQRTGWISPAPAGD
jgi:hypothetical protein